MLLPVFRRDPSTKKLLGNMSMLDGSYLLVKSVNGKSVDKWLKNTFAENPVFTLPVKVSAGGVHSDRWCAV